MAECNKISSDLEDVMILDVGVQANSAAENASVIPDLFDESLD